MLKKSRKVYIRLFGSLSRGFLAPIVMVIRSCKMVAFIGAFMSLNPLSNFWFRWIEPVPLPTSKSFRDRFWQKRLPHRTTSRVDIVSRAVRQIYRVLNFIRLSVLAPNRLRKVVFWHLQINIRPHMWMCKNESFSQTNFSRIRSFPKLQHLRQQESASIWFSGDQ